MIFANSFYGLDSNSIYVIIFIGSALAVGIVGKRAGWFKLVSGTNALLREQNTQLRNTNELLREQIETMRENHTKELKDWQVKHTENVREIGKLQGKIETLSTVPVQSIDKSLKEIAELTRQNAEANRAVLEQLRSSAKIAEDSASATIVKTSIESTKTL